MQTNPAVEQNKNVNWSKESMESVAEKKVYVGKDLPKSQVLRSE